MTRPFKQDLLRLADRGQLSCGHDLTVLVVADDIEEPATGVDEGLDVAYLDPVRKAVVQMFEIIGRVAELSANSSSDRPLASRSRRIALPSP